jgi:hypothetical protein
MSNEEMGGKYETVTDTRPNTWQEEEERIKDM